MSEVVNVRRSQEVLSLRARSRSQGTNPPRNTQRLLNAKAPDANQRHGLWHARCLASLKRLDCFRMLSNDVLSHIQIVS